EQMMSDFLKEKSAKSKEWPLLGVLWVLLTLFILAAVWKYGAIFKIRPKVEIAISRLHLGGALLLLASFTLIPSTYLVLFIFLIFSILPLLISLFFAETILEYIALHFGHGASATFLLLIAATFLATLLFHPKGRNIFKRGLS